jgi:RHS repeat-associated protein
VDAVSQDNFNFASTYYDDSGLRASRTRTDGSTVYYVYDESGMSGNAPLAEYDAGGNLVATNFAAGPDGLRQREYYFSMDDQSQNSGIEATTDYFTYDPLGNPVERMRWDSAYQDNPGVRPDQYVGYSFPPWLMDMFEFDAWGNLNADIDIPTQQEETVIDDIPQQGSDTSTSVYADDEVGYRGEYGYETDPQTGLVLAGHRYYSPFTRRWMNRDPIGYQGGMNLYEYAGDDPVNEIDTSGDSPKYDPNPDDEILDGANLTTDANGIEGPSISPGYFAGTKQSGYANTMWSGLKATLATAPLGAEGPEEDGAIAAAKPAADAAGTTLSRAAEFGIRPYNELRKLIAGKGLNAHHLIEGRFAKVMGEKASEMLSVALTKAEHLAFTKAWRAAISYGKGTANSTPASILTAARNIYRGYPEILRALGLDK